MVGNCWNAGQIKGNTQAWNAVYSTLGHCATGLKCQGQGRWRVWDALKGHTEALYEEVTYQSGRIKLTREHLHTPSYKQGPHIKRDSIGLNKRGKIEQKQQPLRLEKEQANITEVKLEQI